MPPCRARNSICPSAHTESNGDRIRTATMPWREGKCRGRQMQTPRFSMLPESPGRLVIERTHRLLGRRKCELQSARSLPWLITTSPTGLSIRSRTYSECLSLSFVCPYPVSAPANMQEGAKRSWGVVDRGEVGVEFR